MRGLSGEIGKEGAPGNPGIAGPRGESGPAGSRGETVSYWDNILYLLVFFKNKQRSYIRDRLVKMDRKAIEEILVRLDKLDHPVHGDLLVLQEILLK